MFPRNQILKVMRIIDFMSDLILNNYYQGLTLYVQFESWRINYQKKKYLPISNGKV